MIRAVTISALLMSSPASAEERIVSLNPAITEILFALGAGDQIVGTTEYSDFPVAAKKIPRVGAYGQPKIENILALKPTLVLAFAEGVDNTSDVVKKAGIRFVALESRALSSYPKTVREMAKLLHLEKKAEAHLKSWSKEWLPLEKLKKQGRALLQFEVEPSVVAGGDVFLTEILRKCGFENAADSLRGYPRVSEEFLLTVKTDLVIGLFPPEESKKRKAFHETWSHRTGFRGRVLSYDPANISILGPRLPREAKTFCQALAKGAP